MKALALVPILSASIIASITPVAQAETISEHDGGTVHVFFAPVSQDSKSVRGVVAFDNEPGWKSYWRDPGSSGIPPQINIMIEGRPAEAELHFPLPQWQSDDYGGFIGYVGQTNVPFEIALEEPLKASTPVSVSLFAGICKDVCIPITGQLSTMLPLASTSMTSLEQLRIDRSFEELPNPDHPEVDDIGAVQKDDGSVVVTLDGAAPSTSFAVGKLDGEVVVSFGPPEVLSSDGRQTMISFSPRGHFDPDSKFDLHFVAALEPHGYQVTLPVEKEQ